MTNFCILLPRSPPWHATYVLPFKGIVCLIIICMVLPLLPLVGRRLRLLLLGCLLLAC